MIRSLAATIGALAAAAFLAASATPASATTSLDDYFALPFPIPAPHKFDASWHWDSHPALTLNGRYRWCAFAAHMAHRSQPRVVQKTLTLHGRYAWEDDLNAKILRGGRHVYEYRTYLEPMNDRLARGGRKLSFLLYGSWGRGIYHIGSTIDNVRSLRSQPSCRQFAARPMP